MGPRRQRTRTGLLFATGGLATLAAVWLTSPQLSVNWVWFVLFGAAYFALSFRSVEVNDRLLANSSAMPLVTAGVAFALDPRSQGVVLAMGLMAALGPFARGDVRNRRWFQPAANFGQLVISAVAAGYALILVLRLSGGYAPTTQGVAVAATAGFAATTVYTVVNVVLVRVGIRLAYSRPDILPWSGMGTLFFAQTFMGLLGGLLGVVLVESTDSILPLILLVYVIGHLVFSSYSQLREAHESTLKGFVKTLEARDLYTRGHTERVAEFCQLIGERLGFTGTQLEHMRWAALIHDMGKLAIPLDIMQKQGKLTDVEYRKLRVATHKVDDLLSEVDFLRPMVEVASGAHPRLGDEDFGQVGHRHTRRPTLEQKVMAVADAFDAMTSTRGYRMALSQHAALETLREDSDPLFDPDVIDVLENALEAIGRRYGPPHLDLGEIPSGEAVDAQA